MTAAIARKNAWGPGTLLVAEEHDGTTIVIRITAIGEDTLLARGVSRGGKSVAYRENSWNLSYKTWRVAE